MTLKALRDDWIVTSQQMTHNSKYSVDGAFKEGSNGGAIYLPQQPAKDSDHRWNMGRHPNDGGKVAIPLSQAEQSEKLKLDSIHQTWEYGDQQ